MRAKAKKLFLIHVFESFTRFSQNTKIFTGRSSNTYQIAQWCVLCILWNAEFHDTVTINITLATASLLFIICNTRKGANVFWGGSVA